jgi:uncharacterized protein (TIGR03435 family)
VAETVILEGDYVNTMKIQKRGSLLRGHAVPMLAGQVAAVIFFISTVTVLRGQGPPPGPDKQYFEAASVKLTPFPADGRYVIDARFRPNGFDGEYMTLKSYIQIAYGIDSWDHIVGPAWLNDGSPTYSIKANTSEAAPKQTIRNMLKLLLIERFGLKTHTELRDQAVFALVTTPKHSQLTRVQYEEADADQCLRPRPTGMVAKHCSMAAFARALSGYVNLGHPVIDMTGLSGRFDFELRYATRGLAPVLDATAGESGPTLFEALDQVGLRLKERTAPVTVLVIDHANKYATEN